MTAAPPTPERMMAVLAQVHEVVRAADDDIGIDPALAALPGGRVRVSFNAPWPPAPTWTPSATGSPNCTPPPSSLPLSGPWPDASFMLALTTGSPQFPGLRAHPRAQSLTSNPLTALSGFLR